MKLLFLAFLVFVLLCFIPHEEKRLARNLQGGRDADRNADIYKLVQYIGCIFSLVALGGECKGGSSPACSTAVLGVLGNKWRHHLPPTVPLLGE